MKGELEGMGAATAKESGNAVKSEQIHLSIPVNPEYVSIVRLTASVIANRMGFDFEEIEDIKVAVSEACNNVVVHSKGGGNFEIDFMLERERFGVAVRDKGKGFDLGGYAAPNLEDPKEHGLGIFVIKSLMDRVEVDSSNEIGTEIRMFKNL